MRRARPAPRRFAAARVAAALLTILGAAAPSAADERYALIVAGASGGQEYAQRHARWVDGLSKVLASRMMLDPAHITVLSDGPRPEAAATAANVRRAFARLREASSVGDLVFVVLIGHGTFDGVDAKFNLVGPDLEAAEWGSLLDGIAARLVLVNTASASFPFLERLAKPRRIIITATDSPAQRFETVFAEHLIAAFQDEGADIDKNGRVSIWEAFAGASAGVRRHYQQRGQLSTERPLLDDNGDGAGQDAAEPGEDGAVASRTYLDVAAPGAAPTDEALVRLLQRKAALETQVEELRIRRSFMPPDDYAREFERLMIDLALVSREIRQRNAKS